MNSHQHHYTPLCHAGFWVLWLILLVSLLLAAFLVGSSSLSVWQANATPTGAWAMLIPAGGIVMLEVVGAAVLQWLYWRRAASPLSVVPQHGGGCCRCSAGITNGGGDEWILGI